MRNGKHLRERSEALGFWNRDWDERMHDVLDELERAKREAADDRTRLDELKTKWRAALKARHEGV